MSAALRVMDDRQRTFGWGATSRQALAIPPDDLPGWRGRADVVHRPGFFAVKYDLRDDPRYGRLLAAAEQRGLSAEYAIGVLWLVAGLALRNPRPGLMVSQGVAQGVGEIVSFWRLTDGSSDAIRRAVNLLVDAGWLELADLDSAATRTRWPESTERRSRPRAATPETPSAAPAGAAEKLPRPGTDEWGRLIARTADWTRGLRGAAELAPWPANRRDEADLAEATEIAFRAGRMEPLRETLKAACAWAESGAGMRAALRKAGFLPERSRSEA